MKKIALVTVLALGVMLFSALASEAYEWDVMLPNVPGYASDEILVVDTYSWVSPFGYDTHAVQTNNWSIYTASAVELFSDGSPLAMYWADIYSGYYDLYYTTDGYNWYHYGTYYY